LFVHDSEVSFRIAIYLYRPISVCEYSRGRVNNFSGIKEVEPESLVSGARCNLAEQSSAVRFEEVALPHLPAAYNLARWLVRNDQDAEDIVQEAYLRAFKFFGGYRGGESRTWLLTIVRNTCYSWLQRNRARELTESIDETHEDAALDFANPELRLVQDADTQMVRAALTELPIEFREVMVMRELEELSYKQIAAIADLPIGTVMSRLARGRKRLHSLLVTRVGVETKGGAR
jgi:RNA polymerase sigma factor (sigma-70 family)